MGMSSSGGGNRRTISEINVTPLVDVMLVLLIIFMISTPLIVKDESERLVEMNLPVTRENPTTVDVNDTENLILQIDSALRVLLGDELITDCGAARGMADDPGAFAAAAEPCFVEIQQKLGNNPRLADQETLYLLADTSIPYGFVVGTMNRIRLAGVTSVGMVTNPEFLGSTEPAPTPE
ncbi:MAG: biopolymer transport protein TolR [Bradymonadia bacterium]|jgi:biopolymer transport protein TolR